MCCGHNGSGVDPRFLSLVYVVNVTQLSDLIVTNIFSTILQNHTRDFGKDIQTIVPDVIKATSEMFQVSFVQQLFQIFTRISVLVLLKGFLALLSHVFGIISGKYERCLFCR